MITLTAKIDLISGNNGTLSKVSQPMGNNISSTIPLGEKKTSQSPFIIGSSILDGSSTLSDGVDYFIGNQLSNDDGIFEIPYEIVVEGENISSLTIAFDERNKKHPRSIIVDGVSYYDDDAIFTLSLETKNSHTIEISNWNSSNSPFIITGIYVNISIYLDKKNLKSLNRTIMQRENNETPSWGIISNGGNIEFNDTSGEISDYAEQGLLTKSPKVEIYINNTISKTKSLIGIFEAENWDYDYNNRLVSLSLKDGLENLQNIFVKQYDVVSPKYMIDYLEMILNDYLPKNIMYMIDQSAKNRLDKIYCEYPFIDGDKSLWNYIYEICKISGLYAYKEDNGALVFSTEF